MFAGSTAGVYRFAEDGSNLGLDTYDADRPDGIGQGYVGALLAAEEGGLWVGVGGSGLFLREAGSGRYRAFRHDPQLPDSLSGDYVTAPGPGQEWLRLGRYPFERTQSLSHRALVLRAFRRSQRRRP